MWEWIWSDKIVSGINTAYESSRWKSWSEKWEFWETSVDVILFVAVYILLSRGNVKTIDDIRFSKSLVGERLAEHGIDEPDGAVDVDLKALKEAAQAREARSHKGGGNLIMIAQILANTTSRKLGLVNYSIPKAVDDQMGIDMHDCMTRDGTMQFFLRMACANQRRVIADVMTLQDKDFMLKLRMLRKREVSGPVSLREDRVVAEFALGMARRLCSREIMTSSFYEDRPPYNLALYFGNPHEKAQALHFCRRAAEALDVYEKLMDTDEEIKELVTAALWPESVWCREALISARECAYESLGSYIITDLYAILKAPGAKVIEETHRAPGARGRGHINEKLSRNARWHACCTSGVMEENDLRPPKHTTEDKTKAKQETLNNRFYEVSAKESKFSLGPLVYEQLLEQDRR